VSISFKQSKQALNIDSNGHPKNKQKKQKRFKTTKTAQKRVFYISSYGYG